MHISTHPFVMQGAPSMRLLSRQETSPLQTVRPCLAQEHTSPIACTNTSQHTSCTSSANSCLNTSHIDSRGYDSSIKGLHSPCTNTLKANSHITSSAHYATKASQLFHTSTPAHNFSPQLQNLQILRNIPRLTYIISIGSYYPIPSRPDICTGSHC